MRAFIAVEIPSGIRSALFRIITEEKKKDRPVRWVGLNNLHVTLKFLGEITEPTKTEITPAITGVLRRFNPFPMHLTGAGCFPGSRNPRIIWVGVDREGGERLIAIAESLDRLLAGYGIKSEEKKFHPHLTLGRIKTPCLVDDILKRSYPAEPFDVGSITLFRSTLKPEGPIYDKIADFPLGGQGR